MGAQGQGMAKTIHEIAEEGWQMLTSFASIEMNGIHSGFKFDALIPIVNGSLRLALEYGGHSFARIGWINTALHQTLPDCCYKCDGRHRLQ